MQKHYVKNEYFSLVNNKKNYSITFMKEKFQYDLIGESFDCVNYIEVILPQNCDENNIINLLKKYTKMISVHTIKEHNFWRNTFHNKYRFLIDINNNNLYKYDSKEQLLEEIYWTLDRIIE